MKIGYGKLGRSMPLTLDRCGYLGGDVECVAVVKQLAERHPDDQFWLLGRNSGEDPETVGMPHNVINPWSTWAPLLRERLREVRADGGALDVWKQREIMEIFRELTGAHFTLMDAHVWWVGQHGTTNSPLPSVMTPGTLTKPHDWSIYYAGWVLDGINRWRDGDPEVREEVWLNADPRNYLKMRDLKWPLLRPVISQFNFIGRLRHERYDDDRRPQDVPIDWSRHSQDISYQVDPFVWASTVRNTYSRLEVNGLAPGTPFGDLLTFEPRFAGRGRFGVFINESRRGVTESRSRRVALRDYVLPLEPDFIHGTWTAESQNELGVLIDPVEWRGYVPMLQNVRCTLTTPSSGSGWATTKPWEAFAAGTVCFFHPLYDTQDNILRDAPDRLREFLRVADPADLRVKVDQVNDDVGLFKQLVWDQRTYFEREMKNPRWLFEVEERIWR